MDLAGTPPLPTPDVGERVDPWADDLSPAALQNVIDSVRETLDDLCRAAHDARVRTPARRPPLSEAERRRLARCRPPLALRMPEPPVPAFRLSRRWTPIVCEPSRFGPDRFPRPDFVSAVQRPPSVDRAVLAQLQAAAGLILPSP
ncbi:MAG: hypothetical protein AAF772_07050 [Acidobacteriota bacterium]